ncbi:hypothetical protein BN11_2330019 [Nostocoides australiense Ben110]|uniref:Uncharacterized protein n=1 Tax=Nostocoides australiense Ben110 TaxID=1193182 RepID=W6JVR2_9MICO|nr:hypothetical protein BN11_2330019 [Tetrasphaera australiensis Ben110]
MTPRFRRYATIGVLVIMLAWVVLAALL